MTPTSLLKNRTPHEYADAAILVQEAANDLSTRLQWMAIRPKKIVEIGVGLAECSTNLARQYPEADIIVINSAVDFLEYAKQRASIQAEWHHHSLEKLFLPPQSVDLIVANLTLPWLTNWKSILQEWRRALKPNGLLMLSVLGASTLQELSVPIEELPICIDMHNLGDLLVQSGFADPVLDAEYIELSYQDPQKCLYELKSLSMLAKDSFPSLVANHNNKFGVTFEMVYAHTWAKDNECRSDESGTVRIPLSRILKQ